MRTKVYLFESADVVYIMFVMREEQNVRVLTGKELKIFLCSQFSVQKVDNAFPADSLLARHAGQVRVGQERVTKP